jgi:hypothetical protein
MSGLHDPPLGESDTRSKLIDPAIHARGWTEEHIRREETAGAIEIIDGKPRRRSKGRVDYTLRVKVSNGDQPVALGVIEAKAENLPPGHGLEQAKSYARNKRLELFGRLPDAGRSPLLVRALDQMDDYDLYDVLGDLGYGLDPKTRIDRADAFFYKHSAWLAGLPAPAAIRWKQSSASSARREPTPWKVPTFSTRPRSARPAAGMDRSKP